MVIHPIADMFPELSEKEFSELVADIKQHGLLTPVTIDENGILIDGRHRVRACEMLGIPFATVVFTGTDDQKREHSRSLNVHRRHLTPSQRAMRAADAVTTENGFNQHAKKEGRPRGLPSVVTEEMAASEAKVSTRSVKRAKSVKRRGVPELEAAVRAGHVSVATAAKIAKLPKKRQHEAIANGFKLASPRPKSRSVDTVVKNEHQPVIDDGKTPFDLFVEIWESVDNDARLSLRSQIAEFLSLSEFKSLVKPGELFPDIAKSKRLIGRKTPTEDEFEDFWKAFPRKTGKGTARKAFEKAFTNLREQYSIADVIQKIMSGVDMYAKNADPEFLCHPATWLNGCRWDDDAGSIKVKSAGNAGYGVFDRSKKKGGTQW